MGRPRRVNAGGIVYHVLNRANARLRIFFDDGDYAAFEKILDEGLQRWPVRLLAYALMPNHWHMVLWPQHDGELSRFVGWVTLTHTQRWHAFRRNAGTGHLYQGRFKSFPVQEDGHLRTVCRYVERNPLKAELCKRAEDWRWSSLWRRSGNHPGHAIRNPKDNLLSEWPIPRGSDWLNFVNETQSASDEATIEESLSRGRPFGQPAWQTATARRLGLQSTLRPRGRPKKTN